MSIQIKANHMLMTYNKKNLSDRWDLCQQVKGSLQKTVSVEVNVKPNQEIVKLQDELKMLQKPSSKKNVWFQKQHNQDVEINALQKELDNLKMIKAQITEREKASKVIIDNSVSRQERLFRTDIESLKLEHEQNKIKTQKLSLEKAAKEEILNKEKNIKNQQLSALESKSLQLQQVKADIISQIDYYKDQSTKAKAEIEQLQQKISQLNNVLEKTTAENTTQIETNVYTIKENLYHEYLYSPTWKELRFDKDSMYAMTWNTEAPIKGYWKLIHKIENIYYIKNTSDGQCLHSPNHKPLVQYNGNSRFAMTYNNQFAHNHETEWRLENIRDNIFCIVSVGVNDGYLTVLSSRYDHNRRHAMVAVNKQMNWTIRKT